MKPEAPAKNPARGLSIAVKVSRQGDFPAPDAEVRLTDEDQANGKHLWVRFAIRGTKNRPEDPSTAR